MPEKTDRRLPSGQQGNPKQSPGNKSKGNRKSPAAGVSEEAARRRNKAYDLRCRGYTYRQIGTALGVSCKTAHEYVNEEFDRQKEECREGAERLRDIELAKLDTLEGRWMPLSVADDLDITKEVEGRDGKTFTINLDAWDAGIKAAAIVLKIQERRAKLLGLEAPQKVEHSGHLTLDELRSRMQEAEA